MLLGNHLDFNDFEAQNILAQKVGELVLERPNGSFVYLTTGTKRGFYFRVEGDWIYLGELDILPGQGLKKEVISGREYLSVKVDGQTLTINPEGEIQVSVKGIGLNQLDRANIRITDFSEPNENLSFANYRIINLGSPINPTDAATKEYVDVQISQKIEEIVFPEPDLQQVTDQGNSTTHVIKHAPGIDPEDSATYGQVKEITGQRVNLLTSDKNNLVQAINQVASWKIIEW